MTASAGGGPETKQVKASIRFDSNDEWVTMSYDDEWSEPAIALLSNIIQKLLIKLSSEDHDFDFPIKGTTLDDETELTIQDGDELLRIVDRKTSTEGTVAISATLSEENE